MEDAQLIQITLLFGVLIMGSGNPIVSSTVIASKG
jgi:hypothetical protein